MPRHIALLRGINVGGHRVKMDRLRELFVQLGFGDVSTFIASGNVVFTDDSDDTDALEVRIQEYLADELGYGVETFIRSPEQLAEVVRFQPPGHADGRSLYVVFLKEAADAAMRARFAEIDSESDRFTFSDRQIYWSIAGKLSESPLFTKGIGNAVGSASTTSRNKTSLLKLVAKLESS